MINPASVQKGPYRSWLRLLPELRRELSREQEQEHRAAGGRTVAILGGPFPIAVALRVSGMRRQIVTFQAEKAAHITINLETGTVRLELQAHQLWMSNWREVISGWIGGLSKYLTGETVTLENAKAWGWECTRLDLCADFINLALTADDRMNLSTRAKVTIYDKTKVDSTPDIYRDEAPPIETLQAGNLGNVTVISYDKLLEINVHKRGANAPTYVSSWQDSDEWDGGIGRDGRVYGPGLRRVEVKLKDRGLELIERSEDRGAMASKYNLRDPKNVCDPQALATAWTWATTRCVRLVDPTDTRDGEPITRLHRAPTDPRWVAVQAAARLEWSGDIDTDLKQSRRACKDAHEERKKRSTHKLVQALEEFQAQHGLRADTANGRKLIIECARSFAVQDYDMDPPEYGRRYLHRIAKSAGAETASSRAKVLKFFEQNRELLEGLGRLEIMGVIPMIDDDDTLIEESYDLREIQIVDPPPDEEDDTS